MNKELNVVWEQLPREELINLYKSISNLNKKYSQRIAEAIEYIEENCTEYGEGKWAYRTINADNVIDILEGKDNDTK